MAEASDTLGIVYQNLKDAGCDEQTTNNNSVTALLEAGGRLIDTAHIYGNEAAVGRAVRDSDVPREEISIHDDHLTQIVKAIRRDLKIKDKAYPQINLKK